jgi:hypothetical protein
MKYGETTGATYEALAASYAVRSARRAPSKVGWLANESRLSCGRRARRRKAVERQTQRLAGEATQFFPQGQASVKTWQLQLVRQERSADRRDPRPGARETDPHAREPEADAGELGALQMDAEVHQWRREKCQDVEHPIPGPPFARRKSPSPISCAIPIASTATSGATRGVPSSARTAVRPRPTAACSSHPPQGDLPVLLALIGLPPRRIVAERLRNSQRERRCYDAHLRRMFGISPHCFDGVPAKAIARVTSNSDVMTAW